MTRRENRNYASANRADGYRGGTVIDVYPAGLRGIMMRLRVEGTGKGQRSKNLAGGLMFSALLISSVSMPLCAAEYVEHSLSATYSAAVHTPGHMPHWRPSGGYYGPAHASSGPGAQDPAVR